MMKTAGQVSDAGLRASCLKLIFPHCDRERTGTRRLTNAARLGTYVWAVLVGTMLLALSAHGAPVETGKSAAAERKGREHWAFKAPVKPRVPEVKNKNWGRNPIDNFI